MFSMNKKILFSIMGGLLLLVLALGIPAYLDRQEKIKANQDRIIARNNDVKGANPELYNNLVKSIEDSKNAVASDPNNNNAWIDMGVAQQALGDYVEAKKSYEEAVKINPITSVAWNNLATIHLEEQEYSKAENAYKNLLKNIPGEIETYIKLAELYSSGKIGAVHDGVRILEEGIKVTGSQGLKDALQRLQLSGKL
jgi:tetratricopeptide (TPR) repeat protein